jgi:hypothetical protein
MMKIETGKYYRSRDGRKIGPMRAALSKAWVIGKGNQSDPEWLLSGAHTPDVEFGMSSADDLIAEWPDAPDLSNPLGQVFGLMPPETQEAMKAHGGPWECMAFDGIWRDQGEPAWHAGFAYRVKPAPIRETVTAPIWIVKDGMSYHCEAETRTSCYSEGHGAQIVATIEDGKIIDVRLAE